MIGNKNNSQWAGENIQFRLLFVAVFTWFFGRAVLRRMQFLNKQEENCWQEAKRAAYSITPYAFMRI